MSELFAAIVQEASNQGLWPNYLSLDVRSSSRLEAASTGRVLALPGRGEIAAFIKRTVRPFLQEVSKRPSSAARLPVRDSDVQLDIGYDPMQRNAWLTYEGYQRPVEFRRSTLANALKRKARQIKRSGHDGPAGILLCDGGSSQIRDSSLVSQVVEDLFRNYSSVSFICLVEVMTPESSHIHITNEKRPRTVARLPSIKVHHNATAARDARGISGKTEGGDQGIAGSPPHSRECLSKSRAYARPVGGLLSWRSPNPKGRGRPVPPVGPIAHER